MENFLGNWQMYSYFVQIDVNQFKFVVKAVKIFTEALYASTIFVLQLD